MTYEKKQTRVRREKPQQITDEKDPEFMGARFFLLLEEGEGAGIFVQGVCVPTV